MTFTPSSTPSSEATRLTIERLIGEVAERHNVLIGADDPIFMTVTLNERLLAEALARIKAELAASQDQIAAGTAQHLAAAKALSERLITAAAGYAAGEVRAAAGEAADAIRATIAAELAVVRRSAQEVHEARTAAR